MKRRAKRQLELTPAQRAYLAGEGPPSRDDFWEWAIYDENLAGEGDELRRAVAEGHVPAKPFSQKRG